MDAYLKKIYEQMPKNTIIEDYLVLYNIEKGIKKFIPWCMGYQLIFCVTHKNEIYVTKLAGFGHFSNTALVHTSTSFSIHKKKMIISNCREYDGKYSIIRKYNDGRFNSKEELCQFLIER